MRIEELFSDVEKITILVSVKGKPAQVFSAKALNFRIWGLFYDSIKEQCKAWKKEAKA